jgi:hypothetical protein
MVKLDPVSSPYKKPPMMAPNTPMMILAKQPMRELRPVTILAAQPASAPKMIQDNSPIWFSSSYLYGLNCNLIPCHSQQFFNPKAHFFKQPPAMCGVFIL